MTVPASPRWILVAHPSHVHDTLRSCMPEAHAIADAQRVPVYVCSVLAVVAPAPLPPVAVDPKELA